MITAPVMGKNSIKNQNNDQKNSFKFLRLICGSTTTDIKYRSCRKSVLL